jgi:hypothetical protein
MRSTGWHSSLEGQPDTGRRRDLSIAGGNSRLITGALVKTRGPNDHYRDCGGKSSSLGGVPIAMVSTLNENRTGYW